MLIRIGEVQLRMGKAAVPCRQVCCHRLEAYRLNVAQIIAGHNQLTFAVWIIHEMLDICKQIETD